MKRNGILSVEEDDILLIFFKIVCSSAARIIVVIKASALMVKVVSVDLGECGEQLSCAPLSKVFLGTEVDNLVVEKARLILDVVTGDLFNKITR